MSTEKLPQRFEDLKPTELYRSAIEDFALPVDEADKNKKTVLLAAFLEGGVTWDDYVGQHPEVKPVVEDEPLQDKLRAGAVITSSDVAGDTSAALSVEEEPVVIRTAEAPVYRPNEKLLIKMERKNPLYQTRGHTFTSKNPYALVSPEDADYILRHEDGFRQALPSELQEFYG